MHLRQRLVIVVGPLTLAGCGAVEPSAGTRAGIPANESALANLVDTAAAEADDLVGTSHKASILKTRNDRICKVLANAELAPGDGNLTLKDAIGNRYAAALLGGEAFGPRVADWVGKVVKIEDHVDGKDALQIAISPHATVGTREDARIDDSRNTLIAPSSPMFAQVSHMKAGDLVRFSGQFFFNAETCIEETSQSLDGKVANPEFLFRFTALAPYTATAGRAGATTTR